MTDRRAEDIWRRITAVLEEKLQYAFLDYLRTVVSVKLEGNELWLGVCGQESFEFFSAAVNQQRLIIMARPVISLEKLIVRKTDASPIG